MLSTDEGPIPSCSSGCHWQLPVSSPCWTTCRRSASLRDSMPPKPLPDTQQRQSVRRAFEMFVEEVVRDLAHVGREIVLAFGVVRLQVLGAAVQLVDGHRGGDRLPHTGDLEVAV